jgi:hypothetical protein
MKPQRIISLVLACASTQAVLAAPVQVQSQEMQQRTENHVGVSVGDAFVENTISIRAAGGKFGTNF